LFTGAVVGAAELALQPCDGELPTNFNLPFTAAATAAGSVECFPYLCNLAVAPAARRRGVAKRLVRICEEIAMRQWDHDCMYLHVGSGNAAAVALYENSGFVPVPDDERIPTSALGLWIMATLAEPNLKYLYKNLAG
jgi:ribosomal protein S18 acetylase RimI-like enzyme